MMRILVLKRLYNLSDGQMEYQLLDRHSYQRFCGLGVLHVFRIARPSGALKTILA